MSELEKFKRKYDSDYKGYKILTSLTISGLEEEVNKAIEKGYIPTGGLMYSKMNEYIQAVVKI